MKTFVSNPSGYCHGVENAIKKAFLFKKENKDLDVYVLGNIVHNEEVTLELKNNGIYSLDNKFMSNEEKILSIKDGSGLIFSAHGHDEKLELIAKKKNLKILDATCPIVNLAHNHIKKALSEGFEVIYIGKKNHPEAAAALSLDKEKIHLYEINKDFNLDKFINKKIFVTNQTTFSILEIENVFNKIKKVLPNAKFEDEICNATKLRQKAIFNLPDDVDIVFVIGGKESSNTNKLYDIAKSYFKTNKIYKKIRKEK